MGVLVCVAGESGKVRGEGLMFYPLAIVREERALRAIGLFGLMSF